MFAGISGRYDLLNHLLSLNIDRLWRKKAIRLLQPRAGERILDLCTGTADLAIELARQMRNFRGRERKPGVDSSLIVGADFCREMVQLGDRKLRNRLKTPGEDSLIRLVLADALELPFPPASFDAAAVAFGIRNLPDLEGGLREMIRVLRPGGRAALLEFTTPSSGWFRFIFQVYFHGILPRIGGLIARARDPVAGRAYQYLPASVGEFPGAKELAGAMTEAGFTNVRYRHLSGGIACIHLGERPMKSQSGGAAT